VISPKDKTLPSQGEQRDFESSLSSISLDLALIDLVKKLAKVEKEERLGFSIS